MKEYKRPTACWRNQSHCERPHMPDPDNTKRIEYEISHQDMLEATIRAMCRFSETKRMNATQSAYKAILVASVTQIVMTLLDRPVLLSLLWSATLGVIVACTVWINFRRNAIKEATRYVDSLYAEGESNRAALAWSASGICLTDTETNHDFSWRDLMLIRDDPDYLEFISPDETYFIIRKKWFPAAELWCQFRDAVRQYIWEKDLR